MIHILERKQCIPINPTLAWEFISSPANLKIITPDYMKFKIVAGFNEGEKMFTGMQIQYIVRPILSIPLHWTTEIIRVNKPYYFIDEQKKGPYKLWRHKHMLKEIEGGVEMTDVVEYEMPFSFIGEIANYVIVAKQVKDIFEYRRKKLIELFGEYTN